MGILTRIWKGNFVYQEPICFSEDAEGHIAGGHIGSGLGGKQLGHGGVHGVGLVVLLLHGSGVDQELSSLHPGVHLGQLELGVLEQVL